MNDSDKLGFPPIEIEPLNLPGLRVAAASLWVARADRVDPYASGNKLYKLLPNIVQAERLGKTSILTFGGAYSNHLHATALAGAARGWQTLGVVRGDADVPPSATLRDAVAAGMQLQFVSRSEYRCRHDADYLAALQERYPDAFIVPEGGSNRWGVTGCEAITTSINAASPVPLPTLVVACGTGCTLAGMIRAAQPGQKLVGVPVLRDSSLQDRVENWLIDGPTAVDWRLADAYHGGGYAKFPDYLRDFMLEFELLNGLLLDPIYTVKAAFALRELLNAGDVAASDGVVLVHTGGLQGRRGMALP